jgi:phosphoserine phosphatase RsbU/P
VKALVVDDAPDIRIFVRTLLEKWGYETDVASEGLEGFAKLKDSDIPLLVCDWMMPGMSGPELCRAVREAELGRYVYVILLTGRSEKADLVEGLNAGADDFLSKPIDAPVLKARLRVAERILSLEQRLSEQNRQLRDSRNRLEQAYDQIQTDLKAAARVQRQMLPTSDRPVLPLHAEWMFLPAAQVSGDNFNFFELTANLIGFYHLDVSGHGIPAALLSASLSRSLVPGGGPGVAVKADFLDPARFLADLNRQLGSPDGEVEKYATIAYGTIDKRSGEVEIALAGHPHPIVLRHCGKIEYLTAGGLPVGMFPEVTYEPQRLRLDPGDRLILYSDGVTECENVGGDAFGEAQLEAIAISSTCASAPQLTEAIGASLREWRGPGDFEDDISVLVLTRPLESSGECIADATAGRIP